MDIERLEEIEKKFKKIEKKLSNPDIYNDPDKFVKLNKKRASLKKIVDKIEEYKGIKKNIEEAKKIIDNEDGDFAELAKEELKTGKKRIKELENQIKLDLIPEDPNDKKNIIVEIRAGTGGDEAALFVADLYRMYLKYSESKNWKHEIMDVTPTGMGGYKEVIFTLKGDYVFSRMKFESGAHRVQRIPETESGGRIHTSASTVAVLPEAQKVDVKIDPNDLEIDVFRASGAGGQHVNMTDSAVRITHVPTGTVATCQDETSQHKNRKKAMKVLRARIYDEMMRKQKQKRASKRKSMVGSGDRSERIRTYNFPQNRITDHRINYTSYNLDAVMDGDLDELIDSLIEAEQKEKLEEAGF